MEQARPEMHSTCASFLSCGVQNRLLAKMHTKCILTCVHVLTNVNSAFVPTRHGEFTIVSTKVHFVFANVMTRHGQNLYFLIEKNESVDSATMIQEII